jgi:hypothetical protein
VTSLNDSTTKGFAFVKSYIEEDPYKADIMKFSKIAGLESNLPTGRLMEEKSSRKSKGHINHHKKNSARHIDDKTYIED